MFGLNMIQVLGGLMLQKILDMFKKPMIGWVGGLLIGAVAVAMNMSYKDVQSAICSQPVPQEQVQAAPAVK
jgi:hypothetical protein